MQGSGNEALGLVAIQVLVIDLPLIDFLLLGGCKKRKKPPALRQSSIDCQEFPPAQSEVLHSRNKRYVQYFKLLKGL